MTTPSFATPWQRNPDLIATDMDGEIVMMNIERGDYFGIGGVGPRVWGLLENPVTLADIVATLCTEFQVDPATCEADIRVFLQQLQENDLIKPA